MRCKGCDFVYLHPMPSVHEEVGGAPSIDSENIGDAYLAVYIKKLGSKIRHTRRRTKILNRYLSGDDILEIGSNIGAFTENMRRFGKNVIGVEVNPTILSFAKKTFPKNDFRGGLIEDVDFHGKTFDGIYCSEAIEHAPDVNRFAARIAELAKPGAVLYLTTPHVRQYVKKRPVQEWQDFKAPDHKPYFNDANLRGLLARHGFRILRTRFIFFNGL